MKINSRKNRKHKYTFNKKLNQLEKKKRKEKKTAGPDSYW